MPSRINGGRTSLRQEVDFDSLYICPQKMGHALLAGTAVDRWDWRRILENVVRFYKLLDIPKWADSNGLRNLDRKYRLKLCVMTVQSSIQPLGSDPETSSYPRFESHGGTSDSDDRQIGRYDDCLLKFNVSFRHCYGHIGDRQKPGAGRQSPTLFDRFQGVF